MALCDTDKKMIERLRKRQALLIRWRWPLVIFHGCMVVANFVLLIVVANFPDDNMTAKLLVVTYSLPPVFFFLCVSSLWIAYVITNWHGNAKTHLILKLIDEYHQNEA